MAQEKRPEPFSDGQAVKYPRAETGKSGAREPAKLQGAVYIEQHYGLESYYTPLPVAIARRLPQQ